LVFNTEKRRVCDEEKVLMRRKAVFILRFASQFKGSGVTFGVHQGRICYAVLCQIWKELVGELGQIRPNQE
jgi:hypothetical protein